MYHEIYLRDKLISGKNSKSKNRKIREMAGLEILIQKGIMVHAAYNRLKQLAEK